MPIQPQVLWAQRSSASDKYRNIIYLTVNITDIIETTLVCNVMPERISFEAKTSRSRSTQDIEYSFNLDLYEDVIPEESIQQLTSRSFVIILLKKNKNISYWPRLSKQKEKLPFVKTDFNRWIDEDEQNDVDNELVRQVIASTPCFRL
ncbi:hypothetical protein PILCRDRAFT_75808 [Piloderma croceum F 1598]|uniref:CS domain-containing protein n=1 Tax=Piloderma croceum (strain F 1598) TaxID=765440 RepID=A0A0C3F055_PILCF|nr:hypothetical protein PILCRDRAFT_75808 [Piloderma croceum F 1598]